MSRELLMQNSFAWTDAEGRLITVDKALRCNARNLLVEGKTYQNLYKMENVKFDNVGIGGSQELKSDGYFYLNKTAGNYCTITQDLTLPIKSNTIYTLVADVRTNTLSDKMDFNVDYMDKSWFLEKITLPAGTAGRQIYKLTSKSVFPTNESPRPLRTQLSPSTNGILEYKVILLEGDYTNSYIPSNVDGIESVAERESKNLLENVKWHDGMINNDNGQHLDSNVAMYSDLIDIDINTLYYTNLIDNNGNSYRCRLYKADGSYLGQGLTATNTKDMYDRRANLKGLAKIRLLILNKTVTPLPSNPVLLPNPYTETDMYPLQITQSCNETDGIVLPNGVTNTIENGVHVKRIGKAILNGSEQWRVNAISGATITTRFGLYGEELINAKIKGSCLCDRFPNIDSDSDNEHIKIGSPTSRLFIYINKSRLSTDNVDGFKEYLSSNPLTLWYELATPITEPLTPTEIPLPIPLRSLPNGTKDTIEDGKLIQRVNKTIMDGSDDENWVLNNGYLETGTRLNRNAKSNSSMISNYPVVNISYTQENKPYGTFITGEGKLRVVTVTTGNETDLSQAKARLQQNPLEVYYELATPIEHELNIPPISIEKGGNIITTANNITPNLSMKYKKSKK